MNNQNNNDKLLSEEEKIIYNDAYEQGFRDAITQLNDSPTVNDQIEAIIKDILAAGAKLTQADADRILSLTHTQAKRLDSGIESIDEIDFEDEYWQHS
jgi:hypothetical protein